MKKSQLKQTLKPLIKECIKEVFLEQGMLSGIIAEVVKGIRPLQEQQRPQPQTPSQHNDTLKFQQQQLEEQRRELEEERYLQLKEQKKKLLNATGLPTNVFEGVTPLAKGGNVGAKHAGAAGALADMDPRDPGVDISGIMAAAGRNWSKLI